MENVTTGDTYARLFAELARVAYAAKFALCAVEHLFACFTYVDLELNTVLS